MLGLVVCVMHKVRKLNSPKSALRFVVPRWDSHLTMVGRLVHLHDPYRPRAMSPGLLYSW